MRMIQIWTTSTNEWYRQMTRICLIRKWSITDIDWDMSEEEYYLDSDYQGSVADLDGIMSDEEDCCVSDDMDMLEDFVGSDVWSVTDLDSSMTDVDEEDSCDSDMGSVADFDKDT